MAKLDLQAIQDAKDAIGDSASEYVEYMRVIMNNKTFLLPVPSASNLVRPVALTPVPMAPDHLIGIANIKGQIFCIINPGKVLQLADSLKEKNNDTRFLLLRHDRVHLGIWVEAVLGLYTILKSDEPIDSGEKYEKGSLETEFGELPILRVSALFD